MDKIFIHALKAEAIIGIYDWERQVRQTVLIDIEFAADVRKAAMTDSIDDTLNYKRVAKRMDGAQIGFDMLAIPADAPHRQTALQFINFLLQPDVMAGITNAVSYPNPNLAATPFVDPAIRDDLGIYPPASVERLFYIDLPAPRDYERARTRSWTRVKSGC